VVLVDWDRVEDGGEEIGVVYPVVPMAAMGDEVAAQVASALQAESTPPT
jgi:hypothetical protein